MCKNNRFSVVVIFLAGKVVSPGIREYVNKQVKLLRASLTLLDRISAWCTHTGMCSWSTCLESNSVVDLIV